MDRITLTLQLIKDKEKRQTAQMPKTKNHKLKHTIMKNTLSTLEAVNELSAFDAFKNWTLDALSALVENLEQYEEEMEEELELDPIALACNYTYHTCARDLLCDYEPFESVFGKMTDAQAFEELAERTTILPVYGSTSSMQEPDGYVMQMF